MHAPHARLAGGAVVVRLHAGDVQVALCPSDDGYFLPKGGVKSNESLIEAAEREAREEAGLSDLHCLGFVGETLRHNHLNRLTSTYFFLFQSKSQRIQWPVDGGRLPAVWCDPTIARRMLWKDQIAIVEAAVGAAVGQHLKVLSETL